MNHIERVVVDEGVGPDSELMAQFRDRLGEHQVVFVFLASEHPGIPDIEILDKLLDGRSVLLTQDRVLHNLAIGRGFRSMIKTSESGLTDRRLAHVAALDRHLPVVRGTLRDSYAHQADPEAQAITGCVSGFLSAHQLKQFRTKRRRIRAHFGSSDNILAAALTIGQRFLDRDCNEPLHATCWALAHLFQLQLQNYPLTLYYLESAALARCAILIANRGVAVTVVERMVARLLAAVFQPNTAKCTKGRFFDRVSDKLSQLGKFGANELVPFDVQAMAEALSSQC